MGKFCRSFARDLALIILILDLKSCLLASPTEDVLDLPFEKTVIYEQRGPGEFKDSLITSGKIEDGIATFHRAGNADLVISWESVQIILPIYPEKDDIISIEDLRAALSVLKANQEKWSIRPEVSPSALAKWQNRINQILDDKEDKKRKKQEDDSQLILQAAREKAERDAREIAERDARQLNMASEKVANFQEPHTRKEIEEARQICTMLDPSELAKIGNHEKAIAYWQQCLALPADVAMPGVLSDIKNPLQTLNIHSFSIGSGLMIMAWCFLMIPIVLMLYASARLMSLLQERAWLGVGLWSVIAILTGLWLFLLFFYDQGTKVDPSVGGGRETQMVWLALANVREHEVTRFAEKYEVPFGSFFQQIVANAKNIDSHPSDWIPSLSQPPTTAGDSYIEIRVEIPLKWISLPVRISFAAPLTDQEISLKVTGGKIGPLSVGAGGGAWIWEQISPAYQGVVTALGLDQGVRLIMLKSGKLVVSIPEVRAKLKLNP